MSRSFIRLAACAAILCPCLPSTLPSQTASADGELFIRNNVAADICARVRYAGVSLQQAADDVVMKELVAQHGGGGVSAMDRNGNFATPFNMTGMYRACVTSDGRITVKIYRD